MSHPERRSTLAELLPDDVDAILVTKLVNVRYLTGFTGSNGAVLVDRDATAWFATDGRYAEQVRREAPDVVTTVTRDLAPDLVRAAYDRGVRSVAVEHHALTLSAYERVTAAAGMRLVDGGELVERLRVRKDDDEIALLRAACAATDAAFSALCEWLQSGTTERAAAWFLLERMVAAGADAAAFDSIVAFGPHSAIPHHQPTDRPLQRGDLVKVDFGALVGGYHADMTRMLVAGRGSDWQRDLHRLVADVQEKCRQATVVGALPADLDRLAQDLVADSGHELVHGLGHGVGLEIHESPFVVPGTTAARLDDRVAVTVEPGIYLPGRGGVRIEDTVLVGCAGTEPLTASPRELIEI